MPLLRKEGTARAEPVKAALRAVLTDTFFFDWDRFRKKTVGLDGASTGGIMRGSRERGEFGEVLGPRTRMVRVGCGSRMLLSRDTRSRSRERGDIRAMHGGDQEG